MFDAIMEFGLAKTFFSLIVVALFVLAFTHGGKGKGGGGGSSGGGGGGSSAPPPPPSDPA